ncbi:MAG: sulfatase-like hydrolase/transferase [Pirellulales bacterium]
MTDHRASCRCRLHFWAAVRVFLAMALASSFIARGARADEAARPNLVAIVTDDQGRWAMGAYGNDEIHTPAMDRIAREGALFSNAFVSTPVCSPSRATYMTGRWPTQLGITDWLAPRETDDGAGLAGLTWPAVLQKSGYRTALVGKWHLGTLPRFHPTRLGFDHFMGFLEGGNRPMDPTLEVDGEPRELQGPLPDLLVDDAITFIDKHRDGPFALCLHFRAPHLPYGPVPEQDLAPYRDLDPTLDPAVPGFVDRAKVKRSTKAYYASITSVDRNVARLLDQLDAWGLAEHTLVVFTSDHGYNEGRHGVNTKGNGAWIAGGVSGPKRPNMWDTSIRVPLAMRWPAVIRPGVTIDDVVCNIDMFRTMLGALGVPLPDDCQAAGVDFSPLLRGEALPPRGAIFGQYDLQNNGLAYLRMIRTDRYKYVRHFRANFMDELYDLENDPGETKNLARGRANEFGAVEAELRDRLSEWQRSINDPILDAGKY